jgi:hypothetical protein
MADAVIEGDEIDFRLVQERHRVVGRKSRTREGVMNLCKKLRELPPITTDWQQTALCPDCPHYDGGACDNPAHTESDAPCPLDGQPLPLRQVAVDPGDGVPKGCSEPPGEPRSEAAERAIRDEIVRRTGGRVRMLEVQVNGGRVAIRGLTSCYYLKQLAIQAVLAAVRSSRPMRVDFNVLVAGSMR